MSSRGGPDPSLTSKELKSVRLYVERTQRIDLLIFSVANAITIGKILRDGALGGCADNPYMACDLSRLLPSDLAESTTLCIVGTFLDSCRWSFYANLAILGAVWACQILLWLFQVWLVEVRCLVRYRACSNAATATHCKVCSWGVDL